MIVILAAAAGTEHACQKDTDCSLNGVCITASGGAGRCKCTAGWVGDRCSTLQLLPASPDGGLNTRDASGAATSSWGGAVRRLADGTFGMIASEIVGHCGINSWTRNSRLVFATAAWPDGPYTRQHQVQPLFSHEPSLAQAPNGTWVMYFARHMDGGSNGQLPCECENGTTTPGVCSKEAGSTTKLTFMTTAPALAGPWSAATLVPMLDCNASLCQHDMTLAGTILDNGTFVGIVKVHSSGHGGGGHGSEAHRVVALDWADPGGYRQSPNGEDGNLFPASDNPPDGGRVEDPSEPWIDANGHWHALFHAESASGQPWSRSGGHAFSQDGGASWTYTGTAYTTNVSFTDGSAVAFGRRERPHLVFADPARAGLPTHLSTGVQHGDGDATYTLVQPIAVH